MAWCNSCDRHFVSDVALRSHYEHNPRHHWCKKCNRHFSSDSAILNHRIHSSAHHWCRCCGTEFDGDDELEEHIDSEHWHCSDCDEFFEAEMWLRLHYWGSSAHSYCVLCDRHFNNDMSLGHHMKYSSIHVGRSIPCIGPNCTKLFPSVSALTHHLESSACNSRIKRAHVNAFIRSVDPQHFITKPLIRGPLDTDPIIQYTTATQAAWNGHHYQCYFCTKEFFTLIALNQHLNSPAHEAKIYNCPHCQVEFRCFSGLVQHVESEVCGVMRFQRVKQIMAAVVQTAAARMLLA
ncbi:hypothetical protein OE88DRAFT_1169310 [Heliocybe sulcata]|uniref:C2H2-type domain-containing protein n=1 Tax=Heliocybe sulcata TaxID=5364 RepID=A0A5C3NAF4_9AGAM|nr:hypothetical protein OE88DRAFT_1169310 [Heliocybe sulcata]